MTFQVEIGTYKMDTEMQPADAEGNVSTGAPNPTRITWSKENIIKTHEIPYPKHKTSKTSQSTLWKLDVEFNIVTSENMQSIKNMIDNVGPYYVRTAFTSMYMYIESASFTQQSGTNDYYQTCSIKLKEMND